MRSVALRIKGKKVNLFLGGVYQMCCVAVEEAEAEADVGGADVTG
jgi:hypothetical protein